MISKETLFSLLWNAEIENKSDFSSVLGDWDKTGTTLINTSSLYIPEF